MIGIAFNYIKVNINIGNYNTVATLLMFLSFRKSNHHKE